VAQEFNGRRLRQLRNAAGLPPERLALAVGRSAYTISAYERGVAVPSANMVGRLANAVGARVGDLFDDDVVPA
jgi:transcriptional regulator with XRE-family HTH domain